MFLLKYNSQRWSRTHQWGVTGPGSANLSLPFSALCTVEMRTDATSPYWMSHHIPMKGMKLLSLSHPCPCSWPHTLLIPVFPLSIQGGATCHWTPFLAPFSVFFFIFTRKMAIFRPPTLSTLMEPFFLLSLWSVQRRVAFSFLSSPTFKHKITIVSWPFSYFHLFTFGSGQSQGQR